MNLPEKRRAELLAGPYTRLLAEHEDALADFYDFLAEALQKNAKFWHSLAKDERCHKGVILGIDEKLRKGEWRFMRPPFLAADIAQSIEWLDDKKKDITRRGISVREALRFAANLERGMIESRFFCVLDRDTPEMMNALETLANETRAHLARVVREAKRLKWRILGRRTIRPKSSPASAKALNRELLASAKAAQADMLGLMVSLKQRVSELYNAYSGKFPGSRRFWAKLAAEEMQHAATLRTLYKVLDRGSFFRDVERFSSRAIHADAERVANAMFEVRHCALSPSQAVNTALRIEKSMVETGFYNATRFEVPEFKHVASSLVALAEQHIRDLREEVKRATEVP